MNMIDAKIPRRIASSLLQSLTAGVVPRSGLEYINAGRKHEISALLSDLETVSDGGAACRFLVGRYGSGKSFLLGLIRNLALEKGFVVCDCDLSPERRFTGSRGQGLATYRELLHNLSVKTKPEGGALSLLLQRWLSQLMLQTAEEYPEKEEAFRNEKVKEKVRKVISKMEHMVFYYDFAKVMECYLQGYFEADDGKCDLALRWIRGEYETRTEAKKALGVGSIITDENWYDCLKLLAFFVVGAGYRGLILLVDELVNLYKIPQTVTRQSNYEKILTIFNDTLQGKAAHFAIYFCATPQLMDDTRRGLAGYEALRSRLSSGRFVKEGYRDLFGPVIRLDPLTNEELMILCENLQKLHASFYQTEEKLTGGELAGFLQTELSRIGADSLLTPREITRDLLEILNLLQQNPDAMLQDILGGFSFAATSSDKEEIPDDFADFTI